MVAPLVAARAYAAVQDAASIGLAGQAGKTQGPDFGHMVSQAVSQAVGDSRNAEAQMTSQVQGKANIVDVVNQVNAAELTLDTVVAVRDKVVAAYQSIMNMPI